MLALDPELVLAGDIAGVRALLEHVDDDHLDLDGRMGFGSGRSRLGKHTGDSKKQEKRSKEAHT